MNKYDGKDNYGNVYFEDVPVYDLSKRSKT